MIDLSNILGRKEDHHLEAKSAKGGFPDSFWDSYSAFANTDGGVILLGVEEKSDHTLYMKNGLADAEKMKNDFWNMVNNRQKISHNIVTNSMVYVAQLKEKDILVVEVPRAERTARPVFKGLDPRKGTYKRWNEGDHLCSVEELGALLRDASTAPLDAQPILSMDLSVFCEESIKGYRTIFRYTNLNHLWNHLDDELFLRRIKAIAVGEDGCYHPTEAGLLMFGYEYEITNRFPQYFLDYQEDRVMIGVTRWKDRVVSSSGDWSGNLFDFTFKVLPKLQSDLKVPFVLKGMQRVDDTPMHKLLREAVVNTLSNADYFGRQGVVISKSKDGFMFENPGGLRIPKSEAIGGGISDPRNSTILKFFSLIRFGERAGSGLNGIMHVWHHVYHTEANILEKEGVVDRTILSLPFNGHEQDVDAMLELYDNPEELTFKNSTESEVVGLVEKLVEKRSKLGENQEGLGENGSALVEKLGGNQGELVENIGENAKKLGVKLTDNRLKIIMYMFSNPSVTSVELAELLGISVTSIENNIQILRDKLIRRVGPDKGGHWEVIL